MSLYYDAKSVFDSFDSADYRGGYTDPIAIEWRWDVKPWMDVGLQASQLHSWSTNGCLYSLGPQLGFNPMENAWLTVGYNAVSFRDRDFDQAKYNAQGPYLKLRFTFDQNTRLGPDRKTDKARGWDEPPSRTARVTTP